MRNDSTIPIKSNSISVYICRAQADRLEILLLNQDEGSDNWGINYADVKPMEMCWQAALNEVRTCTSDVPDRVYSVDMIETFYDTTSHAIMLAPVFVAFFDSDRATKPMLPSVSSMWIDAYEAEKYLPSLYQGEVLKMIYHEYFMKEPADKFKVYPTRF